MQTTLQTAVARFLRYLNVERNASDLTIKSYREDLMALGDYLGEAFGLGALDPSLTGAGVLTGAAGGGSGAGTGALAGIDIEAFAGGFAGRSAHRRDSEHGCGGCCHCDPGGFQRA